MEKKAIISISSMQMNDEEQVVEVVTPGIFSITEDSFKATYEESEISGMEGTTTSVTIESGKVTLERKGTTETVMLFENNGSNICLYNTPYGVLELTTNTKVLDIDITETGGTVKIDYDLLASSESPIHTSLNLKIKVI
ncbi:DUF1934 domain-containing protein [uncultured Clostridium sp.]|jgi:uncharacterized beta-barrel protein YwiB (DUF1934 family)|uniref:DUF1934 domain-containing protein n=1 Tax=uncultured Clostridium sp. TaxID=59620 RepID=UPI002632A765|nr:DUF1934 domain-containing protein [uncultured Clostridium sp.]